MIIELIGSSGAGKSTITPIVREFFQQHGANVYLRRDAARMCMERLPVGRLVRFMPGQIRDHVIKRVYWNLHRWQENRFKQQHPELIRYVQETQRLRPPESLVQQRNVLPSFRKLMGHYGLLTTMKRPGDVLIFDEGFVHRVIALHVSPVEAPPIETITTYLDLVPRSDLVIYVKTPPDVCIQRVKKRGPASFLASMHDEHMALFFKNMQIVIQLAVSYIQQKGWTVIEVDNSQNDLDQAAAALQMQLRGISLTAGGIESKLHRQTADRLPEG